MSLTPCPGPLARREFLRAGALAWGGLSLAELLAGRARAESAAARATPGVAPSAGDSADTAVILFWMWGGPSQLETWDLKPLAPSEYRGPFRPIATRVPGLDVCELFPRLAALGDKLAVVRSLAHEMSAHNDGSIEHLTGKTPTRPDPTSTARSEHPDFGMVASRLRGPRPGGLPHYVGIPRQPFMTQPTYLGVSHAAYATGDPSVENFLPPNLSLCAGLDGARLDHRRELVLQLDRLRRDVDRRGELAGTGDFRDAALELLTTPTVARAFDLTAEDPATRERYGRHLWGQACLLARRLAESGVGVITIDALAPTLDDRYFSWDDHINPLTGWDLRDAMRYRAPFMDQAVAALIEDIHARGLERRILVLCLGEFGRTPRLVDAQGLLGRDHWPQAQSALLAGGGLRMGQVIGATNARGEYPVERPLAPPDLLATVYRHLGIDPRHMFRDALDRPIPILERGEPIHELV